MVYRDGRPGFIYLASHPAGFLKIGFTVNLEARIKAHSSGVDSPLYIPRAEIALASACHGNYQDEQELHRRFATHRYGTKRSEWYADCAEIRKHFADLRTQQERMGLKMFSVAPTQKPEAPTQKPEDELPSGVEWMFLNEIPSIEDIRQVLNRASEDYRAIFCPGLHEID
jgi:hypothetical protein